MRTDAVLIEAITVGHRHRSVDESKVVVIAASMRQLGLQQPISVWWCSDNDTYHLVAGLHRLRAAESLGWEDIDCFLVEMNEWDRQLWEIDENLCRAELSPVQVAEHTAARKAAWEARRAATAVKQPALPLGPDENADPDGSTGSDGNDKGEGSGSTGATSPPTSRFNKGFAADTAAKTGRSKASTNKALARAEKIAPDVRQAVAGTKLDTGASLDRLAKLTHEEQRKVVADGGFPPPAPSSNSSALVTTARAHPKNDGDVTQPPPSIDELVSGLVARLPAPDDPEQSTQYQLLDLLEQMTSLAAVMCDVFLDAGDDIGAAAIAREFGLPISRMPLNYCTVFDAIDAAKLRPKDVKALGGRHFVNDPQRRRDNLSMEDICDYRKLLERLGLWPKPAPAAIPVEPEMSSSEESPADDQDART